MVISHPQESCCQRRLLARPKEGHDGIDGLITTVISITITLPFMEHLWSTHHTRGWAGSTHYLNHF